MAKVGGCRAVVDTRLLYELAVLATCDLRPAGCTAQLSLRLSVRSSNGSSAVGATM
ncbi:hypothetical protein HBI56_092380 [Parastagonospora nodorum]|uniref:Uncharacterized protein n=1 Tax=Phaeosphaeria nodorum (strain SN15 / ATCC MYA-4574 / FGSC 10173) TaxID=321614 RepID=A0A7U2F423_PHANO|nr:hypothetical protein HBH56_087780 [Parastagonospora nodorum]QRC98002.1 hypothetical protein JI435_411340 [Parastagonospora nodorum SN15]KAH3936304.1 hypothetical protein HBH54_022420 [Parastagonospora nodorum]KAH3945822.1 hypothetical protein HBH53_139530 [Parastagonospora nodorum]KAH3966394.1 hypothetical protein HBH51_145820 [Parastagonospora nodorum]